jgi:RNA recognition motif-containing protein
MESQKSEIFQPENNLLEERAKKAKTKAKRADTGVVLLEGIPHGFYETQIRDYFSQFGEVRRIRVGRSKKSGKSKGYAFVEFLYPEVAQIAAEAMNNYMMFKQVMRTKYIPPAQQHPNMFVRTTMAYYRGHKLPKQRVDAIVALKKSKNAPVPQEAIVKQNKRQLQK